MVHLRIRTKVSLLLAAILLVLFALGESPRGHHYLLGAAPPSTGNRAADAFAADDRAMGAGLAPFVFALVPAVLLLTLTAGFIATDIRRTRGYQHEVR